MRWLRDTRTGRVCKWTPFLAAQQHFEECESPREDSGSEGKPELEAARPTVAPSPPEAAPQVPAAGPSNLPGEELPSANTRAVRQPPTIDLPTNAPGHDSVRTTDRIRIQVKRK